MAAGKRLAKFRVAAAAALLVGAWCGSATAQMVSEDFDAVTGAGGGVFLKGPGTGADVDWDAAITGEAAIGEAVGFARVQMSAQGLPGGGVDGTGAGELAADFLSLNLVDEDFDDVAGFGGGAFLIGDGVTANPSGTTSDWDDGIAGEKAFFVARGGAVLNGAVSAQGLVGGGIAGSGAGEIAVDDVTSNGGDWYGGLEWTVAGLPGGSGTLGNPGFESGGWSTIPDWDTWSAIGEYPSLLIVSTAPQAGAQHIKVWGRASGRNSSGMAQTLRAEEGQTWQLDCWTQHISGDDITGTDNYIEMRIEFYDGVDPEPLAFASGVVLDGSSPMNVWIDNTPIQATAPAGTLNVRAIVQFVNPTGQGGAALIDTVSFDVVSGPPAFDLGDYSLTADIKGDADTGAGERFGHYQLRIEDTDGDRLVFQSAAPADGGWTALGGPLDTATEVNAMNVPASGVFDFDSETFRVRVLFDPERAPGWGAGGALSVDNLVLTNDRPDGSDYSGALVWSNLPVMGVVDPQRLMLTADVKGDAVGAPYELRLSGYIAIPNVDEDFSAITTDDETMFVEPGETGATAVNWSDALENDEVFFAVSGATVTETGGAWVRALATGGYGDDGSCMQIEVLDVWPDTGGYWYAGAVWRQQALPTTDLSQATLTAKVKGEWNAAWLQAPTKYTLRLEDPDGDWIGFQNTYDGTYQSVGGLLANATTSGVAPGGNGVFDVNLDLDYRVVVAFAGTGDQGSFGNWGGTLTIDDVYLSPSVSPKLTEAGRVTFSGVADGSFQSVGGLLSEGQSTWPPAGGQFFPEWGTNVPNWDAGIEGEYAFAGYGWGASIETASAEGCPTCGVGGSGGGVFNVTGIESPPGWYWAGVEWPDVPIDMSNLSQVSFTIDGKGVWNAGAGETPGMITIRLEDQAGKRISWDSGAVDGSFHTLGGTLNTFTQEAGFDTNSPSYSATIIVFGARTPGWGTGATVYFDNVSITDPGGTVLFEDFETVVGPTAGMLDGMDAFGISLVMQDGVFGWPDGGSLVVDNLRYTPVPQSCDVDGDLDLKDFALLQACYTGPGGVAAPACACADVDGDGDVDLTDYAVVAEFVTGPQ